MKREVLPLEEIEKYVSEVFFHKDEIRWAARIVKGILEADSPRVSDIGRAMGVHSPEANCRGVYRFLQKTDPREALRLMYREDAEYIMGDVTEMRRPQALRTEYVGYLKDGKTRGYDLLVLSVPYRGRGIPFQLVSYSSRTLAQEGRSRNQEHRRAWEEVRGMLEGVPLVLDREFCGEEDLEALQRAGIQAVVRLNIGVNPTITFEKGKEDRKISFQLQRGERRSYRGVWYKGRIPVQVAGYWAEKYEEPLWVVTFLEDPEQALELYRKRMKIEEQFRDLKSVFQVEKMMPKRRDILEKLLALVLLAYGIGVLVGENLRDQVYRGKGKKME